MKHPLQFATWILILFGAIVLKAQPGQLRFEPFHPELKQGQVMQVEQDSSGYIWMISDLGLLRWDGSEIKYYFNIPGDSTSLSTNDLYSLAVDHQGSVWVGSSAGVNMLDQKKDQFTNYLPDVVVKAILPLSDGSIWLGTKRSGAFHLDPSTGVSKQYLPDSTDSGSIAGISISDIVRAHNGDVWFAIGDQGFSILRAGHEAFEHLLYDPEHPEILPSPEAKRILQTRDGTYWLATSGGGLTHFDPATGEYKQYLTKPLKGSTSVIGAYSLMEAANGEIWIGTWAGGLNILNRKTGQIRNFRHNPNDPLSLPDDVVIDLFQDKEGLIWVSSSYGKMVVVNPLHDQVVRYVSRPGDPNSISRSSIRGVFEASENELWIGTYGGGLNIYHRDEDRFEVFAYDPEDPNSLPNNTSWGILRSHDGEIWVASTKGICRWRPETRDWDRIPDVDHPEEMFGTNLCMVEGADGTLWCGTWNKGLYAVNPATKSILHFPPGKGPGELDRCGIKQMAIDDQNQLWMATTMGLVRFENADSSFSLVDLQKWGGGNKTSPTVNDLRFDGRGRLWMTTTNGFQWIDPDGKDFRKFGPQDGLVSGSGVGIEIAKNGEAWISTTDGLYRYDEVADTVFRYSIADGFLVDSYGEWCNTAGNSGRLYFGSTQGLVAFFPEDIRTTKEVSPTLITGFFLANRPISVSENGILKESLESNPEITLDYTDYIFSFSFSALTNIKSDLCEYAYRLKGFKDEWLYTDQLNRRATFTNVPSGSYEFQVKSRNGNGVWDEVGKSIPIQILPPWWETWWARLIGLTIILGLAYGLYWTRVSTLRRQKRLLEQRVKERTQEVTVQNQLLSAQKTEIEREKEKSENLLLNILPAAVAEELKVNQKATPRVFSEVSILFSDFVGFTQLTEGLTPVELVAILDTLFREFDRIMERHGLEKIKTIGDAYMCAGGLHNEAQGQAVEVVTAGLDMVKALDAFNLKQAVAGKPEWHIRIGVHTGEVVAGVVGETKFQFDIWGDAVNTASRMESSGQANRVNVSGATHERIKEDFHCTSRGKIAAKNKGLIEMFLVENPSR